MVFSEVGDICIIKVFLENINIIIFYKGVLYRLGKAYVEDDLQTLFLTCVFKEDTKTKII